MSAEIVSERAQEMSVTAATVVWLQRARALWQRAVQFGRRKPRRLRLCESLPLGNGRFVAVVEFENSRFLLGGTSASLVLLAPLGDRRAPGNTQAGPRSEQEER